MLYWIKLCIIFIGILRCFTLRSCRYLMFYLLITPFWAQQYYASKLHSRQNKKFLKCAKEPYASSRTWKINNKLIYVCSWAPLIYSNKVWRARPSNLAAGSLQQHFIRDYFQTLSAKNYTSTIIKVQSLADDVWKSLLFFVLITLRMLPSRGKW